MRSGVKHCIIIGAMKAGTTNLYTSLAKHPNICRARLKEPEFFSPYQSWRPYDSYESLWEVDPNIHLVTLEASTGYTKANSRETPRRMYEYGIRPYLIYILRNPFDRIESHFNFSARSLSIEFDSDIVDEELISPSDYMTHIDRYLEYFPRDRLLILDFAQLNHAKVEVMDSVFDFLGWAEPWPPPYTPRC
ncbi:MAG: sulfotransferase domain-containing protein, partial [Pseudomonadota bacterium]